MSDEPVDRRRLPVPTGTQEQNNGAVRVTASRAPRVQERGSCNSGRMVGLIQLTLGRITAREAGLDMPPVQSMDAIRSSEHTVPHLSSELMLGGR